ncbi:MAG: hypothetical protein FJ303_20685 [Planctomycetes bacterium]|nr:hypothetical protein [Planctomycetota bacterium]
MLTRTVAMFAFGVAAVLFGAAEIDAQQGKSKGPFGPGPGAGSGSDVQKLERDLDRLLEQVAEAKARLAKAKESQAKPKSGFGGKGDFFKNKAEFFKNKADFFKGKGNFFKKKDAPKEAGKGPGEKLDPKTIRERYEYYKKLFDELPKETRKGKGFEGFGKGFGKWFGKKSETKPPAPEPKGKGKGPATPPPATGGPSRSVEARIDALIRELEAIRAEVRSRKK